MSGSLSLPLCRPSDLDAVVPAVTITTASVAIVARVWNARKAPPSGRLSVAGSFNQRSGRLLLPRGRRRPVRVGQGQVDRGRARSPAVRAGHPGVTIRLANQRGMSKKSRDENGTARLHLDFSALQSSSIEYSLGKAHATRNALLEVNLGWPPRLTGRK